MNHQNLPYFNCLRGAISNLVAAAGTAPGAAIQGAIVSRLLDHMIVQRTVALKLKSDCYTAFRTLLPEIEALIGGPSPDAALAIAVAPDVEKMAHGDAVAGALQELRSICASSDIDAFEHFLQLVSEILRVLSVRNGPEVSALCKAIIRIEGNYSRQLQASVDAQVAAMAGENQAASSAHKARTYDEQALLAFIRKTFPQETELGISQSGFVSGGYSKFTVSIALSNAKSLPQDIILRGDADAAFGGVSVVDEYRLIKAVYEHGVCVPKPLALEQSGGVFGSAFMLVEKRPGTIIGHMFNLPSPNKAVCADVAAKLATIHRVPLSAIGAQIDGADTPSSAKVLAWIDEGYNNWRALNMPSPVFEIAWEWLRRNAGINDMAPRALVHADYGLNNLLIHENRVSAILDWEFAHIGNPAYDLGYFYCMAQALSSWEDFLEAYEKEGMTVPDSMQLDYNILLAATRLGTMACQIVGAFTSGIESGIAGAAVVGGNYYELCTKRIADALERVF